MRNRGAFCLLLVLLCCSMSMAQDETAGPTTVEDPQIAVEDLELRLLPLRRAEVEAELNAWVDLLEELVAELSSVEIATRAAEGDDKVALLNTASELRDRRAALVQRINVVRADYERKGGDASEQQAYIAAVTPLPRVDVTDTTGTWILFRNWLRSPEGGTKVGLNIIKFIVTLIAFWIVALIVGGIVHRAVSTMKKSSQMLKGFLSGLVRKVILLIGLIVAISMLGVNITPLVAAIGAAGLVIGFALQGTLSNFASGLLILIYRPYDVGDFINAAGVTGKVKSMTLVSTSITTADNQAVMIPNNSIWGGVITNITGNNTRRVDMTIGVSYDDDLDKVLRILGEVVRSHELVLEDPEPNIQVSSLGDSSVEFIVRPWVKTADYWTVFWDLTKSIKQRLDQEDITIPFPQRDVHIYQHIDGEEEMQD